MKNYFLLLTFISLGFTSFAQDLLDGNLHGNFQIDVQTYKKDSLIGAPFVPEKALMNGFTILNYTKGHFTAGLRYESYLNPLQGFDPRYKGSGITNRFVTYSVEKMEITAGNYYEQFGSGLLLRTYYEPSLGFDNSLDGFRLKFNPLKGIVLKTIWGRQRSFFVLGEGIVRGADAEIQLNEVFSKFNESKTNISIGGSVVSKYQSDQDPTYNLPENVAAFAGRTSISRGKVSFSTEYAYKINDPSTVNNNIYAAGNALMSSISYSQKGLGANLSVKRIDNMNFRSDRTATGNNLNINFIPPIAKQHTYQLLTIYPYASQPNGEMGIQGDIFYTFKPGSKFGGKYGTNINLNYARIHGIDTVSYGDERGYKSGFFKIGKKLYFQDYNIEFVKKITRDLKVNLTLARFVYNIDVVQGLVGKGTVHANIVVADITYKFTANKSLRTEMQHLSSEKNPKNPDNGNWVQGLAEFSVAPHWFLTILDAYNYDNIIPGRELQYASGGITYIQNALRISLGYGKQRAGLLCVGGVCRTVPASNGFSLSISGSF